MRTELLTAIILSLGLFGCGRDATIPPSPGVTLVANARASGIPTIAEFGAKTCVSCRDMEVILDNVARKSVGKSHVLLIDISQDNEAAQAFQIRFMPTQVFFDAQGRETGRHIGKLSETQVMEKLGHGS
jgi:thioredoxin 1